MLALHLFVYDSSWSGQTKTSFLCRDKTNISIPASLPSSFWSIFSWLMSDKLLFCKIWPLCILASPTSQLPGIHFFLIKPQRYLALLPLHPDILIHILYQVTYRFNWPSSPPDQDKREESDGFDATNSLGTIVIVFLNENIALSDFYVFVVVVKMMYSRANQ